MATPGLSMVSGLGGLFNSIYEDAIFVAQERNIMVPLVTPYSATGWMVREVVKYGAYPTAQEVAEGEDYANPQHLDKTSVTLTPGEVMVQSILTDRRIETDPDGARADHASWLGQAISNKVETDLLALFQSFTLYVGDGSGDVTVDKIAAGIALLRVSTKGAGPIYVMLHPYQWYVIWNELGTPAATMAFQGDVANEALRQGFVGNWLGASWFQNANIEISEAGDAYGAVFTRKALALDTRKAPVLEPERDASLRAWELNLSAGYAKGIRRNEHGVYLLFDASTPS